MSKRKLILSVFVLIAVGTVILIFVGKKDSSKGVWVYYPFNNALFPPEFPAPAFEWKGPDKDPVSWNITLKTRNNEYVINATTKKTKWTPEESEWEKIKSNSHSKKIIFSVKNANDNKENGQVAFSISADSVGAPILYRQIPLPSVFAEKNLNMMNYMLINIGSKNPPYVAMRGFPVCGNCHSFSADGSSIGLDLDAGRRDKGGYFISPIKDTILFNLENYRSWSRIEKRSTFGLFSKMSPDGRHIVTTVRDRVIFVNYPVNSYDHIAFSQLFFPINGHLAIYDRETGILKELPGANLDEYVQSNAFWTPDGKNIVFSRAEAVPMDSNKFEINVQNQKLIKQYTDKEKKIKYDICIVPFNNGEGGEAEPIKGASANGMSNYFPAVSPDGKWLVYCQAESFMLLQPDSRLYIVPLEGGKARMLKCNLPSLNSWHAWSPNSKWLVYVSKGLSTYSDLFLTHIDEKGNASIPVLVDKARADKRVANYPEFINRKADFTFDMEYDFVELAHIKKALRENDREKAKQLFHRLESQNPFLFSEDCLELSGYLIRMNMMDEAKKYAEMSAKTINSKVFIPEEE